MNDLILESIRVILVAFIMVILLRAEHQRKHFPNNGWTLILNGFGLIFIGTIFDFLDNFDSLNQYFIIGSTESHIYIEELVGYIGGFSLLALGLNQWLPLVAGAEKLSEVSGKLHFANEKLQQQNATLYANEERFRAIFDNSEVGIATLHPNGYFEDVNTVYQNIMGYSESELSKLRWQELAAPEDLKASEKIFEKVKSEKIQEGSLKRKCLRKDGSSVTSRFRLSAIRKGEGEPVSYYILLMDT
jgi:PAS domain S-box-containing protein